MKENKKYYIISGVLFIIFAIFTVLVKSVDVQIFERTNSEIGFASINIPFANSLQFNESIYKISEYLGYIAIVTVGYFGLFGVMQLFMKKGFTKVDKDLYALAGLYAALLVCYVVFDKVVINYRPVIIDIEEGLEPSYPSSHTMMSVGFMLAAIQQFSMRLKKSTVKTIIIAVCALVGVGIIVTRFLAGVHWLTDIIGAILLASSWFMLYYSVVRTIYKDRFNR